MTTEVRERGLPMSGPMLADHAGEKTITRRIIKPQPIASVVDLKPHSSVPGYWVPYAADGRMVNNNPGSKKDDCGYTCRYGMAGDWLYNRELLRERPAGWIYAADEKPVMVRREHEAEMVAWAHHKEQDYCPSIHMPKWASRTWKELVEVRAERVQDITEADAVAEGFHAHTRHQVFGLIPDWDNQMVHVSARTNFRSTWDSLNDARGYGFFQNPYVWVLVYKILSTTGRPLDREED